MTLQATLERQGVTDAPAPSAEVLMEEARRHQRRRRRRTVGGFLAAFAAGLIATWGVGGFSGGDHLLDPSGYPQKFGFLPAPTGLSSRLVFPTTVVQRGASVTGQLIVTNSTDRTIKVERNSQPAFAVGLTDQSVPLNVAFGGEGDPRPLLIHPGTNRFALQLQIRYANCANGGEVRAQPHVCGLNGPSPLPVGHYEALLVPDGGLALPPPAPVSFTVINE